MRSKCSILLDAILIVDNNINTSIRSSGVLVHNDVYLALFFSLTICIPQQCSALNLQQQKLPRLWQHIFVARRVRILLKHDFQASRQLSYYCELVLITGVSPGSLGSATAMAIASQQPQRLLLCSRTMENIHSVIDDIHSVYPSTVIEPVLMDLSSQKSVRAAAAEVDSRISKLDVLINNAGIMAVPDRTLSEDGIEIQFATNHLGHFLFTNLILKKLQAAAKDAKKDGDTRVINLSSNGHRISPVRFSDWNFENKIVPPEEQADEEAYKARGQTLEWSNGYEKLVAYGQSKTASILFSLYLRNNLVESGIWSFSVHPGSMLRLCA